MKLFKRTIKNKKGSIQDLFLIGAVLLFFALITLLGFKLHQEWDDQIQGMGDIPTEAKTASTHLLGNYSGTIDNMYLFLAVGLSIITIVLAALVRIHPVFAIFFFIGLTFVIFYCGIMSNIYGEFAGNSELITQADQLIFISNIMGKLPFFIGIIGFILMIVSYKTWRASQIGI